MDDDRPELRSRSPEIEREQSRVLKWFLVTVACVWLAGGIAIGMTHLAPSIAIYFLSLFAVAVFPLAKAFMHIHVWIRLDHEYRERYEIKYDNWLIQYIADRPYSFAAVVAGSVFAVVAALAVLGS